jgi:hypothetical protein
LIPFLIRVHPRLKNTGFSDSLCERVEDKEFDHGWARINADKTGCASALLGISAACAPLVNPGDPAVPQKLHLLFIQIDNCSFIFIKSGK